MKSKFKIAIMGCGRIATKHIEALTKNDNFELVGICDPDFSKASKLAKKFCLSAYESIQTMDAACEIDVISVLTESGNHADDAIQVLKLGKNVVVEKPMALTVPECVAMINKSQEVNRRLFVVKQNRFNPAIESLVSLINADGLGLINIANVRVRWCREQSYYAQAEWRGTYRWDGGVLCNQASHHIDMLQWLVGPIDEVFGYSGRFLAEIESEDSAVVVMKSQKGAIVSLEATTATRPKDIEGSISIMGDKGIVEVGGFAMNQIKTCETTDKIELPSSDTIPPNVYGFGHIKFYEHVADSLLTGEPSFLEGPEGLKTVQILNAIYESFETKLPVKVNNIEFSNNLTRAVYKHD